MEQTPQVRWRRAEYRLPFRRYSYDVARRRLAEPGDCFFEVSLRAVLSQHFDDGAERRRTGEPCAVGEFVPDADGSEHVDCREVADLDTARSFDERPRCMEVVLSERFLLRSLPSDDIRLEGLRDGDAAPSTFGRVAALCLSSYSTASASVRK